MCSSDLRWTTGRTVPEAVPGRRPGRRRDRRRGRRRGQREGLRRGRRRRAPPSRPFPARRGGGRVPGPAATAVPCRPYCRPLSTGPSSIQLLPLRSSTSRPHRVTAFDRPGGPSRCVRSPPGPALPSGRSWPGAGVIALHKIRPDATRGRTPPHWAAHGPVRIEPPLPGAEFGRPREDDRRRAQGNPSAGKATSHRGTARRRAENPFPPPRSACGTRRKAISGPAPRPPRQPLACPCAPRPSTRLPSHS